MVKIQRVRRGRINVIVDGVIKGYVVSNLGVFGAFKVNGERIIDGQNLYWTTQREAINAVAGC